MNVVFKLHLVLMLALAYTGCATRRQQKLSSSPEGRALSFLETEVPAWSRENRCFSCHNNGDAARALYEATGQGFIIPKRVLADTTEWLAQPEKWHENKGNPAFSDQQLANIQFAFALVASREAGLLKSSEALDVAARIIASDQHADGAWHIGPSGTIGSPATYGTHLATATSIHVLRQTNPSGYARHIAKAERWFKETPVRTVLDAAACLLALSCKSDEQSREKWNVCFDRIRRSQTRDGGWGPYTDSPPEAFDTAIALIALAQAPDLRGSHEMIRRGREFLVELQNLDGSWPETTRPSNGESYAQRISTTGWATLALLKTRQIAEPKI